MVYYCDDEVIDLNDKTMRLIKDPHRGFTLEGTSYEKDGFVYKIYYSNNDDDEEEIYMLDEKSCQKLTTITTKRMFLPIGVIYDEDNNYAGCKSVLIKPLDKDEKRIVEKTVSEFFDDISEIETDLDTLGKNRVLVSDFGIHNMIDNGNINIYDAGGYKVDFDKCYSPAVIKNRNYSELEILITEMIDEELHNLCSNEDSFLQKSSYLRSLARYSGYLKMLEKETRSYGSIVEFSKDIAKSKVKGI